MITWKKIRDELQCQCTDSDAWRCARDRKLHSVACHCGCHKYIERHANELPGQKEEK
jgi:hypothetical protein